LADHTFKATLTAIRKLRNAVAHTDPLDHHGYSVRGRFELRVSLSTEQASALQCLLSARQETRPQWGLVDHRALNRPWRFADRLYRASIEAWMQVVNALLACAGRSPPFSDAGSDQCGHDKPGVIRSYGRVLSLRSNHERTLLAGFADWSLHQDLSRTIGRA
jgi:hypothetical protein